MAFYQSIAEYYDYIFPFNPAQQEFVLNSIDNPQKARLLDVGCGSGSLCLKLAPHFKEVIGIDPDESMLELAKVKADDKHGNLSFLPGGMLDLNSGESFRGIDLVLCFGNTLVHLSNEDEIHDFLVRAKAILNPGGKLLIQIINYDRIFDQMIRGLPTIENSRIRFVRNYHYKAEQNSLDFETILTIKNTGKVIMNNVHLFPIRSGKLLELLEKAGFSDIIFYGNFKKGASSIDAIPLVIEAGCKK